MSQHVQEHVNRINNALPSGVPAGYERAVERVADAYAQRDNEIADQIRSAARTADVPRGDVEDVLESTGLVVPEPQRGSDFNGNGGVQADVPPWAQAALRQLEELGRTVQTLRAAAERHGVRL